MTLNSSPGTSRSQLSAMFLTQGPGVIFGDDEAEEDVCPFDSVPAVAAQEDAITNAEGLDNTEGSLSQADTQTDASHGQLLDASAKPFQRWIKTLHKRAMRRQDIVACDEIFSPGFPETEGETSVAWRSAHHRPSSSDSSLALVTAVRSANLSLAGISLLTHSRMDTLRRSRRGHSTTDPSSRASASGLRLSEDSVCADQPQAPVDPAVLERSLHRHRILEELISTEESYIGDVRFLTNVYVTILASLTSPAGLRSSVNRNLADIVELHEEILDELRRAVPDSEYSRLELQSQRAQLSPPARCHRRWRSMDAVPEDQGGISWSKDACGLMADPQTVAEVAKVFLKKMNRFFVYEEYGAKYQLMVRDVAGAHRTMPGWLSYQKGLEVLAASLDSAASHRGHAKKSLTIGDLLVKPIQRVCKYPLLFSELLRHTPVIDCPHSHMEVENVLVRLREATAEINRATDDPRTRSALEKTWILQDRLVFPDLQLDAALRSRIRSFGRVQLCGALHVCWQTKEGADGQYLVALLYREWLCFATAGRIHHIYTILACIALANIKVEEVDNGRGLQCHTAQHSWKIVFLCDHQLYELILTACSPKEETEWRSRLNSSQQAAIGRGQDQLQPETSSFLSLNIRALGTVFRGPETIDRKISIHRATTIGPKPPFFQVILQNTSAVKEASTSSHVSRRINRSQSLLTTNSRIPVLAPSWRERARLEALLSDVWTRDVLPFPGVTARSRSEQLVRASASSVMRKLSVVGIGSSFAKRSASLGSLQLQKEKGGSATGSSGGDKISRTSEGTRTAKPAVTQQWHCAQPASPVLSPITDQAERCGSPSSSRQAHQGEAAGHSGPRADVDSVGSGSERHGTQHAKRGICVPPADVPPPAPDQAEEERTEAAAPARTCEPSVTSPASFLDRRSSRPSLQRSTFSQASAEPKKGCSPPPLGPGHSLDHGQRQDNTKTAFPSQGTLLGKLAKVRVKHREAVAEGIRSFFR